MVMSHKNNKDVGLCTLVSHCFFWVSILFTIGVILLALQHGGQNGKYR